MVHLRQNLLFAIFENSSLSPELGQPLLGLKCDLLIVVSQLLVSLILLDQNRRKLKMLSTLHSVSRLHGFLNYGFLILEFSDVARSNFGGFVEGDFGHCSLVVLLAVTGLGISEILLRLLSSLSPQYMTRNIFVLKFFFFNLEAQLYL